MPDNGGKASQPVCANSPTPSEIITRPAPATNSQKLSELTNGKATSRAPICSGTTTFIRPVISGIATKKIMITPWAVKIWS
ncbi:hypothetical protein D3C71_1256700 [compost metagenome]